MKQSLTSIVWKNSFPRKILFLNQTIFLFGILSLLVDSNVFLFFFSWKSYFIFKMLFALNFTCFIEDIVKITMKIFYNMNDKFKTQSTPQQEINISEEEIHLEWISIKEILRFVFARGGFKNSDFLREFWNNNKLYKRIWNILEEKGILIRGEKNARVLNPEETIESCVEKLSRQTIQKENDYYYSFNG